MRIALLLIALSLLVAGTLGAQAPRPCEQDVAEAQFRMGGFKELLQIEQAKHAETKRQLDELLKKSAEKEKK